MPSADVPVHRPSPALLLSTRFLHDLSCTPRIAALAQPLGLDRTTCLTRVRPPRVSPCDSIAPTRFLVHVRLSMSVPRCDHDNLSSMASPTPMTPSGSPDSSIPALVSCVFLPFCLVFRIFSSTLLPMLHRSCLFGTIRESATVCPSSLRGLLVDSVFLSSLATSTTGQDGFPG